MLIFTILSHRKNLMIQNYMNIGCHVSRKIIEKLGEPTKGIFIQCYFQNKKYAEVAQEYHISSSGIKKHVMKVLRLIRREFDIE